jgi:PmbA protein
VSQTCLANSLGYDAAFDKTTCGLNFEGLLLVDSRFIWFYEFKNLSREFNLDPAAFVRRLARLAQQARKPASLKSGRYPCIFIQSAGIDILSALLPAINGKGLEKNMSPLIGKENKKLFDEKLTISDDGLLDFGFGSAPFDGDGIAQRRTPIIEGGIFRNFLFDLKTAAATQRDSTGNASRSYRSPPVPGTSNIVVEPGNLSLEQAIAGIKEGVLVYGLVGGGQSNVLAGDFSVSISLGYKIENGEVTGRVKDAMVAGNIYEIGRKIAGLGDTLYDFGSMQLPFLMFEDLPIAAKE